MEAAPIQIGGFTLVEEIGSGSMGRVFRARQRQPAREVALKLVSALGPESRLRLAREMEALARLEHPGIARLYAAGSETLNGVEQPWLAMEYVRGRDLCDWAKDVSLSARIEAMAQICRAVHHAHGRGIIHRDLKPANILVEPGGQPRVLDFGVARVLESDGAATRQGQVLGSLPYMSPEQLGGDSHAVDARSDIYALGAIAYELLTGAVPHPGLLDASLFKALSIHRDEKIAPPSSRVPATRGDLDAVVMKALATEPERRYASAAEFAADFERWLQHRPVEARPATPGYVMRRFMRRHRAASLAAGMVLLCLVIATAVSLRFAWRAQQAQALAEQRAAETGAVNAFLERMLVAADPAQAQGRNVSVAEVLDAAEHTLAAESPTTPVRAAVLRTLAGTRLALGEYEHALALNAQALADLPTTDATNRLGLLRMRGSILTELGRFEEAAAALDEAGKSVDEATPAARYGLRLTRARLDDEAGRTDQAMAGYREVIAAIEGAGLPANDLSVEISRSNLASLLRSEGRFEEALALSETVLEHRRRRYGERHPRTLATRHTRSLILQDAGQLDLAAAESEAVLALRRNVLGNDHAHTMTTAQMLANMRLEQGRLDEAAPLIDESLAFFTTRLGESHAQTITSLNSLAYLHAERQEFSRAEATYRRIVALQRELNDKHPATLGPQNNLAMLLLDAGRLQAAETEFRELIERSRAILGDAHPLAAVFQSNLGLCLGKQGRDTEAIEVLTRARDRLAESFGPDHTRTRTAGERLADIQRRQPGAPVPPEGDGT